MKLTLPFPTSINAAYATNFKTKRRFKSQKYSQWVAYAEACVMEQHPERISGPVKVLYEYGRPDKRRRDVGNYEKVISDLLVSCGLIEDDSLIEEITLRWADVDGVEITVTKWENIT